MNPQNGATGDASQVMRGKLELPVAASSFNSVSKVSVSSSVLENPGGGLMADADLFKKRSLTKEEVDRFFKTPMPVVPEHVKAAIVKAIYDSKVRTDGELFTPLRPCDDPTIPKERCGKKMTCGHICDEPKRDRHECGRICAVVKTLMRPCGHETYVYCHRTSTTVKCTDICGKAVSCGHRCRKACHFEGEPCPTTCDDFYCKNGIPKVPVKTWGRPVEDDEDYW